MAAEEDDTAAGRPLSGGEGRSGKLIYLVPPYLFRRRDERPIRREERQARFTGVEAREGGTREERRGGPTNSDSRRKKLSTIKGARNGASERGIIT